MSEIRGLLERAQSRYPAPDHVLDRLTERRDRKRRNRRIASAVLGLALAALAIGGLLRSFATERNPRPASNQTKITSQSVGDLHRTWVGLMPHTPGSDHGITEPPVVEGNRAYADSSGFFLYAFGTSCGSSGDSCLALWIASTRGSTNGIAGRVVWPAAAADGRVYEAWIDRAVYAFPASCGSEAADCKPLWVGPITGVPSSPLIEGDAVYIFAGRTLYAFGTDCAEGGAKCQPIWTSVIEGKATLRDPAHVAVAGGVLYVSVDRSLYAFPTDCTSTCQPIWRSANLVEGSSISPPVIGDGMVFVSSGPGSGSGVNALAAFSSACQGSCEPLWTWTASGVGISNPVVSDGNVYVTERDPQGESSLVAFEAACRRDGGVCAPTWTAPGQGQPATSGPTVYVDDGARDAVVAYRAGCASGGATCTAEAIFTGGSGEPVVAGELLFVAPRSGDAVLAFDTNCAGTCSSAWTGRVQGRVQSGPVVSADGVYVGTSEGTLVAFRLATSTSGIQATAVGGAALLVIVAIVVGLIAWRRRREARAWR
jgi:outer membrane protein assembly factor BamB